MAVTVALSVFGAMLALMALRVPIAAAMFVPGAVGYWLLAGEAPLLAHLKGAVWARFSNYDLTVIPLFLLMGQFASQGGLSRDLFRAANAVVGRLRGGMAMAAVLACAAFGAICGSSVATAATIGQVALPEMRRAGYSGRLATATLAAGGTLGILIPPSVVLVIYAILAEQSVGKLFAAALVPGFIAAVGYVVAIAVQVRRHPELAPPPAPEPGSHWRELAAVWPVLAIFVVVFGGIYGGLFTPTEGAAVGAAATLVMALARGELGVATLGRCFLGTAETTAMVFLIFIGADMLNATLALSQVPAQVAQAVATLDVPPLLVVAAILVFYILLGAVMDELAMIVLTIPVLFPAVMGLDLWGLAAADKAIWFGILVLMVVEVGLIAPPVGLNVYVIHGLARDVPMAETYRGVMPFLVSDAFRILLLLMFPSVSLFLVRWMG
ncbi:MAG: TRAP transporter large permease [Sterolibacteriaceae bacterium MAG5]|nr:TRAP transporter large permease [Candidatus Nitricoxidireducens bremensis]